MNDIPNCRRCGLKMKLERKPFTVDKKERYMVSWVCRCGHRSPWMTEEMIEQARCLPEVM